MEASVEGRKERGSYKARFPAHHRRRKQLARMQQADHQFGALAPAAAPDYVIAKPPAAAASSNNTIGFGIIDWADAVLEDLNEHGGWAHRKRHVVGGRRRQRHSADDDFNGDSSARSHTVWDKSQEQCYSSASEWCV